MKRTVFIGLGLLVCVSIGGILYLGLLSQEIIEKFSGQKWDLPSKVYSDSTPIYPGLNLHAIQLKERLERLGYQEVTDQPTQPGEYKIEVDTPHNRLFWKLYLHDFEYPLRHQKAQMVQFEVTDHIIYNLTTAPHPKAPFEETSIVEIEPELITEFFDHAREDRRIVKLQEVPPYLLNAIVSVEDQRFLTHGGIDPRGILRAFFLNLRAGTIVQGGSTITQQLVKNFFSLTQKKSYLRKINEAIIALMIERQFSKDEILESYINEIYFGQRGSTGIYGVAEAARFYFGKPLSKLTLAECATLAGIIRGPGVYSPFVNAKKTIFRRNFVLKQMLQTQTILQNEYSQALRAPLRPRRKPLPVNIAPYFVDFVRNELLQKYPKAVLTTQGFRIFTTLDITYQSFAREAVKTTLAHLEKQFLHLAPISEEPPLQGALISLQPQTGYIRALVGGRDYGQSQFNRISQAKRQPGSLFKPLVLLSALLEKKGKKFKLTDRFSDSPFTWKYDGQVWEPRNYEEKEEGEVTLRNAVERSINIPIARLSKEVGPKKLARLIKRLGVGSKVPALPSLSLGSIEVSPLEMATVYSVLANNGVKASPISIRHVIDPQGNILEKKTVSVATIVPEEQAFLVSYALQGVIDHGTGRGVRLFGFSRPAAGKTGTTNNAMDAWFAGYTPELVTIAWAGFDKEKPIGLTGALAALPIWTRFMIKATESRPLSPFVPPTTIQFRLIDPETGGLATKACPDTFREAFHEDHIETAPCTKHPGKLKEPITP